MTHRLSEYRTLVAAGVPPAVEPGVPPGGIPQGSWSQCASKIGRFSLPLRRRHLPSAVLAITILAGLLGIAPLANAASKPAPAKAGDPFPALGSFGLEGKIPDLAGKVVLVDFWASWCAPCVKSFPMMKELHEALAARGFLVVAISLDERKASMESFLKKARPPFSTLRDPKGRLAEALGVDVLPTTMIVDTDGKILAVHDGFEGEASRKKYLAEIDAALKKAGR